MNYKIIKNMIEMEIYNIFYEFLYGPKEFA